jgi:hypothetical protein
VEDGLIIKKNVNIMKKVKLYIELYYPVILSFLSFLYSVSLWFGGNKLEGIFVGIWVPSILAFAIAIRQRRNDFFRQQAYKNRRKGNQKRRRK